MAYFCSSHIERIAADFLRKSVAANVACKISKIFYKQLTDYNPPFID
jgi:hypothetical protein